jgi:hypothetical protein
MDSSRLFWGFMALVAILNGCSARSRNEFIPGPAADFRSAADAEVRNAQGQVILTGKFVESSADGDEVERKATLSGTGIDADASGAVEVESCRNADCRAQEVEFEVTGVEPGAVIRFVIGGKEFATVTTDARGRATVERDVPLPR